MDEQRLEFDDLTPGRVFELGTVLAERAEMIAFARRFDPQPFHLEDAAGAESLFGRLAASGWYTASLWMRAYVDAVLSRTDALGSPGGEEIRWPAPVHPDDELRAVLEIVSARRSASRPGLGLARVLGTLHRDDTLVFTATFTAMFRAP